MLGYREGVRFLLLASDTGASSLDQVDSRSGNKFFDLSSCISSRDPFGRKDGLLLHGTERGIETNETAFGTMLLSWSRW